VIFDELHKMKGWKNWLKGVFDEDGVTPPIVVTGSARLDIARRMGDSLAGRHFLYRLHPFTVSEVAGQTDCGDALDRLLTVGGFPEPFLNNDLDWYRRWRRAHLDAILRQDLLDLEQVRALTGIETMVELLRGRVGSPVSYQSLSRDLAVSATTVKRWVEILENLFVVFRVTPWHRNIARSLLKEPKVYFFDSGQVEGTDGARLENVVATALLREAHFLEDTKGLRCNLHYLRTRDGREVDFLLAVEKQPILAVEVKWSDEDISPHLRHFCGELPPHTRCVQLARTLKHERDVGKTLHVRKAAPWLAGLSRELCRTVASTRWRYPVSISRSSSFQSRP
jgi:hypothetical protein